MLFLYGIIFFYMLRIKIKYKVFSNTVPKFTAMTTISLLSKVNEAAWNDSISVAKNIYNCRSYLYSKLSALCNNTYTMYKYHVRHLVISPSIRTLLIKKKCRAFVIIFRLFWTLLIVFCTFCFSPLFSDYHIIFLNFYFNSKLLLLTFLFIYCLKLILA